MEPSPWWKQLLTADRESKVFDLVRLSFAIAFLTGIGLQIYSVVRQHATFDIQAFGTGFGLMIAGAGGAMAFRKDREDG